MAERTLNRTITIVGVCEPSRRSVTMTFFLSLREESVLPFTVAADSYLQNVLPPFYSCTPHKARKSRANRPASCSFRPFDGRISDRLAVSCRRGVSVSSPTFVRSFILQSQLFLKAKKLVTSFNKAKQHLLRGNWLKIANGECRVWIDLIHPRQLTILKYRRKNVPCSASSVFPIATTRQSYMVDRRVKTRDLRERTT